MNMSTPGNAAKLGTAHSNIQTAQSCLSLVEIEPAIHYPTMPTVRHGMNVLNVNQIILNREIKLNDGKCTHWAYWCQREFSE